MMASVQDLFFAYAAAFEQTYADDDWERLRPFFAADAVYEVVGGPMACRIEGVDGILAGMKKSLDGLDRRCDRRFIDVTGAPEIDGDTLRISWAAGYEVGDSPRGQFPGKSEATLRDGQIVELKDIYDDASMGPFSEWKEQYAPDLDGSYV
jgi:hypothetical protein